MPPLVYVNASLLSAVCAHTIILSLEKKEGSVIGPRHGLEIEEHTVKNLLAVVYFKYNDMVTFISHV